MCIYFNEKYLNLFYAFNNYNFMKIIWNLDKILKIIFFFLNIKIKLYDYPKLYFSLQLKILEMLVLLHWILLSFLLNFIELMKITIIWISQILFYFVKTRILCKIYFFNIDVVVFVLFFNKFQEKRLLLFV